MPDRNAAVGLRVLAPRATLLGSGDSDSLQNVNTTPLPDGSLCWVGDQTAFYVLHKDGTDTPISPIVVAPAAGPGRWFQIPTGDGTGLPTELTPYNFGAVGDDTADDTVAVQAWVNAIVSTGRIGVVPEGVFSVETVTWPSVFTLGQGVVLRSAGMHKAIFRSRSGADIFDIPTTAFNHSDVSDIGFDGGANAPGGGSGLYLHPGQATGLFTFKNLWFSNFGRSGIRCPDIMFSCSFENVNVDFCYADGLDIFGGGQNTFTNCYWHTVPTAGTYGIHFWAGAPIFVGCNGIDGGSGGWGRFGADIATDGQTAYCNPLFLAANFEALSPATPGVRLMTGSNPIFGGSNKWQIYDNVVNAVALRIDHASGGYIDHASAMVKGAGSSWLDGCAIHVTLGGGVPPLIRGVLYDEASLPITTYRDDGAGTTYLLPIQSEVFSNSVWQVSYKGLAMTGPFNDAFQDFGTNVSGTFTWFSYYGNKQQITLSGDVLITGGNYAAGSTIVLFVQQPAAGNKHATWDTMFHFPTGVTGTLSTAGDALDIFTFETRLVAGIPHLYCVSAAKGF